MSKSILLSIKPKWVKMILSGDKTIEVRKKFPKDYKGWIYLYCCKGGVPVFIPWEFEVEKQEDGTYKALTDFEKGNGKVVARFYCDKVEEIKNLGSYFITWSLNCDELLKNSCLNWEELFDYLRKPLNRGSSVLGYAIHISDLEIFDEPKELSEFKTYKTYNFKDLHNCRLSLTKAPQNFVYIEIEKNEPNNI